MIKQFNTMVKNDLWEGKVPKIAKAVELPKEEGGSA